MFNPYLPGLNRHFFSPYDKIIILNCNFVKWKFHWNMFENFQLFIQNKISTLRKMITIYRKEEWKKEKFKLIPKGYNLNIFQHSNVYFAHWMSRKICRVQDTLQANQEFKKNTYIASYSIMRISLKSWSIIYKLQYQEKIFLNKT